MTRRLITQEEIQAWTLGQISMEDIGKSIGRNAATVGAMIEMAMGTDAYQEAIKNNRNRKRPTAPIIVAAEDLKAWFLRDIGLMELKKKYAMSAERITKSMKFSANKFFEEVELLRNPNTVKFIRARCDLISDADFDRLINKEITLAQLSRDLQCNYQTLQIQYKKKKLNRKNEANNEE